MSRTLTNDEIAFMTGATGAFAVIGYFWPFAWFYIATTVFAYILTDLGLSYFIGPIGDDATAGRGRFNRSYRTIFVAVLIGIVASSLIADGVTHFLFDPNAPDVRGSLAILSLFVVATLNLHVRKYME